MTVPCKGISGFLFGHKFKARSDDKWSPSDPAGVQSLTNQDAVWWAQQLAHNCSLESCITALAAHEDIYVRDICVRCGVTIEREEPS